MASQSNDAFFDAEDEANPGVMRAVNAFKGKSSLGGSLSTEPMSGSLSGTDDIGIGEEEGDEFFPDDELNGELDNTTEDDIQVIYDEAALKDVINAFTTFLTNNFIGAEEMLRKKASSSLYHQLAYSVILFFKALISLADEDIEKAASQLKITTALSHRCRRRKGVLHRVGSAVSSGLSALKRRMRSSSNALSEMKDSSGVFYGFTKDQMHAEIIYADSLLLKSILSIMSDENLFVLLRTGMAFRSGFAIYRNMWNLMQKVSAKSDARSDSLAKGIPSDMFDGHIASGIDLGLGGFNVIVSLLPSRVMKLMELIGFTGNRGFGLQRLEHGTGVPFQAAGKTNGVENFDEKLASSLCGPLCGFLLLFYFLVICGLLGIAEQEEERNKCGILVDYYMKQYPNSAFISYFKGRHYMLEKEVDQALKTFEFAVQVQSDWPQLHHLCYWEMIWCYAARLEWKKASEIAQLLYRESRWSKCFCLYLVAIFKYMAYQASLNAADTAIVPDKESTEWNLITEAMQHLQSLKQRVAGKSVPLEKFVCRKARKFFMQEERLLFPGYEMMYAMHTWQFMKEEPCRKVLENLEKVIADLSERAARLGISLASPYSNTQNNSNDDVSIGRSSITITEMDEGFEYFFDDWCLALLLKGSLERLLGLQEKAEATLKLQLSFENRVKLDHWVIPYAHYELGLVAHAKGEKEVAHQSFIRAKEKYSHFSLETRLHFRIHGILTTDH